MTPRSMESRRAYRALDATKRREDLLRMLKVEGCPLCAVAAAAEENWFEWYRIEKNAEAQMVIHLRRSHGLCPPHTRALGIDRANNGFLTSMLVDVTRYGLAEPASLPCPACSAVVEATQRELQRLVTGLGDPTVASAFEASSGLCAPHAFAGLASAPPPVVSVIVATLHEQLNDHAKLAMVAGRDDDAEARAMLLAAGHKTLETELEHLVELDPIERMATELNVAACPACRAFERGVVGYFRFLGEESTHSSRAAEVAMLCPTHLHDLAHLDERASGWALSAVARRLDLELRNFDEVVQWNALALRRRAKVAWHASTRRWRAPLQALGGAKRHAVSVGVAHRLEGQWECRACAAGETLRDRVLGLFRAAAGEPRIEKVLAASYGFCLRHAAGVPSATTVLNRRLRVEEWELEEATRKIAWDTRYEPKGIEYEAWRPTVGLYDGANYLGLSVDEIAQRIAVDVDASEQDGA